MKINTIPLLLGAVVTLGLAILTRPEGFYPMIAACIVLSALSIAMDTAKK